MGCEGQRGGVSMALRVLVADERGRPGAAPGLSRWLACVAPARVRGSVSIAMVSDARMRQLNRRYRGVDHATDVLSFPATSCVVGEDFLGDIAISGAGAGGRAV